MSKTKDINQLLKLLEINLITFNCFTPSFKPVQNLKYFSLNDILRMKGYTVIIKQLIFSEISQVSHSITK